MERSFIVKTVATVVYENWVEITDEEIDEGLATADGVESIAEEQTEAVKELVLPSACMPEPLGAVTVQQAQAMMSDREAENGLSEQAEGWRDTEVYRGSRRAEVNIDSIAEVFPRGAIVTLNSLKEKRLVPPSTGFVKILARGTLDKPLTVVAQDFSTAALKMILLTGGHAVVAEPSAERSGKRLPHGK